MRVPSKRLTVAFALSAVIICPVTRAGLLEHWTTNLVSNMAGMDCVVYANGRYVAFGEYSDYGVIFSSEDGLNWTLRADAGPPSTSGPSYSVAMCFTGNRFFALGGFGGSSVSSNGIDWVDFSFPTFPVPSGVAFSGSRYAATGAAGNLVDDNICTSSDGITWTGQHSTSPNGAGLSDIAFGAGKFVALGGPGGITDLGHSYTATSLGITWTQHSLPAGGTHISFYKGIFVIPFSGGTNLISADGINWATAPTGITNRLGKVVFYNGILMARADSWLATSSDGTNWVRYTQAIPGNSFRPPDIATDGSRLVTVGWNFEPGPNYYKGFIYTCDELTTMSIMRSPPGTLTISGLVGRTNRVEFADNLPVTGNAWQPLTNVLLTVTPTVVTDPSVQAVPVRFYRSRLLP